ncbi:hypothetical protein E2C01_049032 [Portunus trituberculatus]|uniref:Uncharacterized protein n=1 Tax=Portunus trituberculatus TaxID=210409 RepID=A0A5B7GD46_PORTR|nr:hypothetical protein [Portunus trituberculatus]
MTCLRVSLVPPAGSGGSGASSQAAAVIQYQAAATREAGDTGALPCLAPHDVEVIILVTGSTWTT